MTSQTGRRIIIINIWTNTSRSKGNQAMKFVQLIEYNDRKSFFQKSGRK